VALVHGRVPGPECLQQIQGCLAVHPLTSVSLTQQPVRTFWALILRRGLSS
jgi:hypothetical protein